MLLSYTTNIQIKLSSNVYQAIGKRLPLFLACNCLSWPCLCFYYGEVKRILKPTGCSFNDTSKDFAPLLFLREDDPKSTTERHYPKPPPHSVQISACQNIVQGACITSLHSIIGWFLSWFMQPCFHPSTINTVELGTLCKFGKFGKFISSIMPVFVVMWGMIRWIVELLDCREVLLWGRELSTVLHIKCGDMPNSTSKMLLCNFLKKELLILNLSALSAVRYFKILKTY